jgi:2-polyprenyl-3-methyl-5-hydroxy-6-metoxy-1,4-benzoquinol methylase
MDATHLLGEIRHRIRRTLHLSTPAHRPLSARLDAAGWWDHLYSTYAPYSAVGNFAFDEEWNQREHAQRWDFVTSVLEPDVSLSGTRVLEAGCGPGMFTMRLLEAGARVTAFDISSVAIDRWKEFVGPTDRADVRQATMEDFTSTDRFDLVLCLGVLVSIREDAVQERAFLNLASYLKEPGHLLVEEMLADVPEARTDHPQLRFRSLEEYRSLADRAGLRLVRDVTRPARVEGRPWHALLFARRD